MDDENLFRQTEHITITSTSADGQTTRENWPVSKTDYAGMLASATLLPARVTVQFERAWTHDDLLMASGEFYWNWLDEPADGLVFTAFHHGGQLPQVVMRYFDETNSLLIAGMDEAKVRAVKEQAEKL